MTALFCNLVELDREEIGGQKARKTGRNVSTLTSRLG